jgi:hypothetical protein
MITASSLREKNSIAASAEDGSKGRMRKASTPMREAAGRSLRQIRYFAGEATIRVIS